MSEETKEKTAKKSSKKTTKEAVATEPVTFAVIRTSGKQYRVSPGTKVRVDLLESKVGDTISFSDVLLAGTVGGSDLKVATASGAPIGVTVSGKVLAQMKEKKVIIFKKRRRGGYTKKQGHRQQKTEVLIDTVSL